MDSLISRLTFRVHDVIIKGNTKTKDSLIEAEVASAFRDATSWEQLQRAKNVAGMQLVGFDIFDSVKVNLDAGPPELPGTVNVVVEVSEDNRPLTAGFGIFQSGSEATSISQSVQGSLKLKNLFGYGDIWDSSVAYRWGQTPEFSTGVSLPRFKAISSPLSARISLLSKDWLKLTSYKEQGLGLSLGLLSKGNHDLSYNLAWRTLTDPTQMASHAVRRQLGHSLLAALKYTYNIDRRNSPLRPTRGYAFASTSQIGGLFHDIRSLRFIRQEVDLRYAIPLGFNRAALNLGISGGAIFPWGGGSLSAQSYLPERFFMGGNSSPLWSLRGPSSLLGFKAGGLAPAEHRRAVVDNSTGGNSDGSGIDHIGGDIAVSAFADLSFDLPVKALRDAGIHGHAFACAGSLNKLTENSYRELSLQKFIDSFRSSVGCGFVMLTHLFRMEVNYVHILKQQGHDQGKSGVQFSFSSPE